MPDAQPDPRMQEISRALKRGSLDEARLLLTDYMDGDRRAAERALVALLETAPRRELTPVQLSLLRSIADGIDPDRIAAHHGFTGDALRAQLSAAFLTLGARNRAHAIAICFRRGLIT